MGIYCTRDNWSRVKSETNCLKCNYAHKPLTGREIFDLYNGCL